MTSRIVLVHGHIFKNAGTTLDWALKRNFRAGFVDHRDDKAMRQGGAQYLGPYLQANPQVVALSSHHLCFPLPDLPATQIIPIYIFRHPIERVLSVYEFERRQRASTPGAINAKRMDLAEYVRWRLTPQAGATIRNYHTRYLSGMQRAPRRPVRPAEYDLALHNLCGGACIGLVERYDESLVLFEYTLRNSLPELNLAYIPQNVGKNRRPDCQTSIQELRDRLGRSLFEELEHANEFDLALYGEAQSLVDERCQAIPDMQTRLADFSERCQKLR